MQKTLAKRYKHLNGNSYKMFLGRVPSTLKMVVTELSLTKKKNELGEYDPIQAEVIITHFNGKVITMKCKIIDDLYYCRIADLKIAETDLEILEKSKIFSV